MGRKRIFSIREIKEKKFIEIDISEQWKQVLGRGVVKKFHCSITGDSSNGKTVFTLMLAKELSKFGKVLVNSVEQGVNKTLQDNIALVDLPTNGRIQVAENMTFDELYSRLSNKHSRCNYLIIDTRDFMDLTMKQYNALKELKKGRISIITLHHSDGGVMPLSADGKWMRRDADVKIHVKHFIAYSISRFGETQPFVIYEKGHLQEMEKQGIKSKIIQMPAEPSPTKTATN